MNGDTCFFITHCESGNWNATVDLYSIAIKMHRLYAIYVEEMVVACKEMK